MAYGQAHANALWALADPTRRRVFERLKDGPHAVTDIARGLPVSRPAVSQHLKVLKEAGLVADRPEGTRRVYYIDPHGLGALLSDVVLTRDEISGLTAGLLVSDDPPLGELAFSAWLDEHADEIGRRYANELDRHFAVA